MGWQPSMDILMSISPATLLNMPHFSPNWSDPNVQHHISAFYHNRHYYIADNTAISSFRKQDPHAMTFHKNTRVIIFSEHLEESYCSRWPLWVSDRLDNSWSDTQSTRTGPYLAISPSWNTPIWGQRRITASTNSLKPRHLIRLSNIGQASDSFITDASRVCYMKCS